MHTDISITKAVEGYIVAIQSTSDPINKLRTVVDQHVFLTLDEVKAFISSSLDVPVTGSLNNVPTNPSGSPLQNANN